MIIRLARIFRLSAFSVVLAYALLLNVLLAGFAQGAMIDQSLSGGGVICTIGTPSGEQKTAPDHACQMCCLAAQGQAGVPPIVTALIARLMVVSAMVFPRETAGAAFNAANCAQARGPPLS
jgi:hypothetical protein